MVSLVSPLFVSPPLCIEQCIAPIILTDSLVDQSIQLMLLIESVVVVVYLYSPADAVGPANLPGMAAALECASFNSSTTTGTRQLSGELNLHQEAARPVSFAVRNDRQTIRFGWTTLIYI